MAVIMPANVYGVFEREAVPDPAGTGNNSVLSWSVEESASTMVTATAGAAKNSPRRRHKRLASAGDTSWGSAGAVAIAFVAACLLLVVLAVRQMRTLRGPQSVRLAFAPPALSDPKHVKDAVALLKAATAASSSASASASPTTGTAATTPEKVTPASSSNVAKASNLTPPSGVMKLEGYIKKRSGGGENARWEVWDGTTVLHPAYGQAAPCRWAVYHPPTSVRQQLLHKKPPGSGRMCLYPDVQDRFVSKTIAEKGHWEDCDDLTDSLRGVDKSRAAVYVDIGTNIGACVMQVLLTTDASVVAFEPSPPNLFRLTSTLLDLPRHVRDRVALFPVALGEATGTVSIMANPNNSGNTQVRRSDGETGVDGASQETRDIPVERIDDLLSPKLQIDLVKMDAQGYECFVVNGMKQMLKNVGRVKFEIDDAIGKRFGDADACVGARLVKALQLSGFVVTASNGTQIGDMTGISQHDLLAVDIPNPQDLFAEKRTAEQRS